MSRAVVGARIGLGVALLVVAGAPGVGWSQAVAGYRVGDMAPVIEVNDLDGLPVDLGEYLGKVPVVLEFWATWCERCEALLPHVRQVADRYGDRVAIVGINIAVNQSPARVRRYVSEHEPPFRTLYDNLGVSVRAYHVPTTSYVVIVDREGIIRYIGVGADQDLDAVLAGLAEDGEEQP